VWVVELATKPLSVRYFKLIVEDGDVFVDPKRVHPGSCWAVGVQ
jgi:hypothetical protein